MKVPVSWLAEHLADPLPPIAGVADQLAVSGVEVERVERRGLPAADGNDERYVAGLVLEAGKHPNADRLQLCRVDTGGAKPRQVVCGAWNFGAGDTVAVAVPGAVLPDGRTLERAKLRGAVSDGMILSERELELSTDHDGILVLGPGYAPGEPLISRLPLREEVLHLEVSSNRPDLLSVRGVARDVAAVLELRLADLDESEPEAAGRVPTGELIQIAIDDPDLCFRFTARVFSDVRIAPSPLWLKARLSAAGIRPISNVVDVTNYVMHDLGNPLHAYDAAKVPGRVLTARRARAGEAITTLDGKDRKLEPSMLVIADADGPSGIGGIMGGAGSEISDETTEVVLEAANFERVQVMRTSRALGLRTDGSNRWEKGVDPYLAPIASRAAARLLVELTGGAMAPETIDVVAALPEPARLHLRHALVGRVTGAAITPDEAEGALARLGFEPVSSNGGWDVRVPSPRWLDVTREIDLVEEVARVVGLDRVPSTLPTGARAGGLTAGQRLRRALEDAAVGAGLNQATTLSMVSEAAIARLGLAAGDPRGRPLPLANPLSAEHDRMRTMLLPSLLDSLHHNAAMGVKDVGLFEIAHVYHAVEGEPLPHEPWTLGAALQGRVGGSSWRGSGLESSFFAAKGVLAALLGAVGASFEVRREDGRDPFLHPGRSARVLVAGEDVGFLGELHPAAAERFGLESPVAAFEIDLDALLRLRGPAPLAAPVPDVPPLRQDIAVVVADEHDAGDVAAAVQAAGGELLADVELFDVYRDRALGAGRRSLAFRLTFQAPDRTLTDAEVAPLRERVVGELSDRFGAELRA